MQADQEYILEMIKGLKEISEPCSDGVQRRSYTPEYRRGANYVADRMKEEGLSVWEDGAGNLFGTLKPGSENSKSGRCPAIFSGSHLDTVKCAGAYDGIAGVICALEAARMIKRSGKPLKHPYTVFGTIEEEGTRFGQVVLGSKFMAGVFDGSVLDRFRDPETGQSFREILADYHAMTGPVDSAGRKGREMDLQDPEGILNTSKLDPDRVKAFIELHGEQGAVLESRSCDIGVVECVAGIVWMEITVLGMAGHSGTVPMNLRRDAGLAAGRMILALNDYVTDHYAGKATLTAGRIKLDPGSANCIPGKCTFSLDIRSGNSEILSDITDHVDLYASELKNRGFSLEINLLSQRDPIRFDKGIEKMIEESARERGLSSMRIDSGAGHDSMVFARTWPTGMIFLPNRDGLSHHPDEYISPPALKKGAEVLYDTIRKIDGLPDSRPEDSGQ